MQMPVPHVRLAMQDHRYPAVRNTHPRRYAHVPSLAPVCEALPDCDEESSQRWLEDEEARALWQLAGSTLMRFGADIEPDCVDEDVSIKVELEDHSGHDDDEDEDEDDDPVTALEMITRLRTLTLTIQTTTP